MELLGITGPIKHGKSALIESFKKAEPSTRNLESSTVITIAANQLHATLADMAAPPDMSHPESVREWIERELPAALQSATPLPFDASRLQLDAAEIHRGSLQHAKLAAYLLMVRHQPALQQQTIGLNNKDEFRPLLQWIGGYTTSRLGRSLWYEEMVRQAHAAAETGCKLFVFGGVRYSDDADVLRTAGGSLLAIYRPDMPTPDADDPTEQARQQLQPDTTVVNNGSLDQLDDVALRIISDVRRSKLLEEYQAKAF